MYVYLCVVLHNNADPFWNHLGIPLPASRFVLLLSEGLAFA